MTDIEESIPAIPPVIAPLPPPPPHPTWPTWVEILLCSGYPTQILIGQALLAAGLRPLDADGELSGTFVFALSITDTVVLLTLIIVLLRRRGERPLAVFFGGRPSWPEVGAGVLSVPLVIMVMVVLMMTIRQFLPSLHNVPENPLEGLIDSGFSLWLFMAVVIIAGGVREELQRAFLLHRFRGDLGLPWLGLFIASLSFGLGHTLQGLDAAVVTGTLGAIWGAMYLLRGSALGPMVSHSLFNSGEVIRALLR